MLRFCEMNPEKEKWILDKKLSKNFTDIETLALDCVFHLLNTEYMLELSGEETSLEKDAECTFISNDELYIEDEVFRIIINDTYYVFDHLYITTSNHIILVANEVKTVWDDDNVVVERINNGEYEKFYFKIEY